ncbi:MAG: transposase [Blastocatellia bacterium]
MADAGRVVAIWRTPKDKRNEGRVSYLELQDWRTHLTTLDNWLDEITNYFLDRQTSGFQEGFNNKIKVLKRRCYGITNISHLFQRIWLDLEGFKLFGI